MSERYDLVCSDFDRARANGCVPCCAERLAMCRRSSTGLRTRPIWRRSTSSRQARDLRRVATAAPGRASSRSPPQRSSSPSSRGRRPRRRRDASRPTVTDRDRAPDDASATAALTHGPSRSRRGRTSSTRSPEHRRHGSSPPSAPGGWTSGRRVEPHEARRHPDARSDVGRNTATRRSASWPSAAPAPCSQTPATGSDGNHPGPVTTLDGLVAALSEQQGWAEVTAPSDISVDGYVGKAFQRTAPTDMSDCGTRSTGTRECRDGHGDDSDFRSWENASDGRRRTTTNRARSRPCGSSTSTARSS